MQSVPKVETSLTKGLRIYKFRELQDREVFAELYFLLAKEEVSSGTLERFAADRKATSGKQFNLFANKSQGLDQAFLADLDQYRENLAKAFKKDNPELDGETLTEITQRTLDRLVFIRFLEDKLILSDEVVAQFANAKQPWQTFTAVSKKLNAQYNGIVFKPLPALDDLYVQEANLMSQYLRRPQPRLQRI